MLNIKDTGFAELTITKEITFNIINCEIEIHDEEIEEINFIELVKAQAKYMTDKEFNNAIKHLIIELKACKIK